MRTAADTCEAMRPSLMKRSMYEEMHAKPAMKKSEVDLCDLLWETSSATPTNKLAAMTLHGEPHDVEREPLNVWNL